MCDKCKMALVVDQLVGLSGYSRVSCALDALADATPFLCISMS
jgi:hypothetical protein